MTARLLLHDSHADGSGAPGERAYVAELNARIVPLAAARGFEVIRVPGDGRTHLELGRDAVAFVAPHYDADIYNHRGGAFWDRAAASATAARDDLLGDAIWSRFRSLAGAPADHFERRNANTRDYYAFRMTTANTPGVILELGVGAPVCNGHGQPAAPDHDWLRARIDDVARAIAEGVLAFHLGLNGGATVNGSPIRMGQSADLLLAQGEVGWLTAFWNYAGIGQRTISRKVVGYSAGRRIYTMYPPVDPDADPTEDVSAEPAIFVVDTTV